MFQNHLNDEYIVSAFAASACHDVWQADNSVVPAHLSVNFETGRQPNCSIKLRIFGFPTTGGIRYEVARRPFEGTFC